MISGGAAAVTGVVSPCSRAWGARSPDRSCDAATLDARRVVGADDLGLARRTGRLRRRYGLDEPLCGRHSPAPFANRPEMLNGTAGRSSPIATSRVQGNIEYPST